MERSLIIFDNTIVNFKYYSFKFSHSAVVHDFKNFLENVDRDVLDFNAILILRSIYSVKSKSTNLLEIADQPGSEDVGMSSQNHSMCEEILVLNEKSDIGALFIAEFDWSRPYFFIVRIGHFD